MSQSRCPGRQVKKLLEGGGNDPLCANCCSWVTVNEDGELTSVLPVRECSGVLKRDTEDMEEKALLEFI